MSGIGATPTPSLPPRRRRKWPLRVLWGFLFIAVGVVGFWNWKYWTALSERDALITEIRSRGEPVWIEDVIEAGRKMCPPITGASVIEQMIETLPSRPQPRLTSQEARAIDERVRSSFDDPQPDPKLRSELASSASVFACLEDAVQRPPGNLLVGPLDAEPTGRYGQQNEDWREIERLLRWRVYDAMSRGDSKEGYRTVRLHLEVADQLSVVPLYANHYLRRGLILHACDRLVDCLQRVVPDAKELEWIDRWFAKRDFTKEVERLMVGERAFWLSVYERPSQIAREHAQYAFRNLSPMEKAVNQRWTELVTSPVGRPLTLKTQSAYMRASRQLIESLADPIDPDAAERIRERYRAESPLVRSLDEFSMTEGSLRSFGQWHWSQWRPVLSRLALRLRRHHDLHGRFPKSLDELCDESMPQVPLNWFQDQSLVYTPSTEGFLLDLPTGLRRFKRGRIDVKENGATLFGIAFKLKTATPKAAQ